MSDLQRPLMPVDHKHTHVVISTACYCSPVLNTTEVSEQCQYSHLYTYFPQICQAGFERFHVDRRTNGRSYLQQAKAPEHCAASDGRQKLLFDVAIRNAGFRDLKL